MDPQLQAILTALFGPAATLVVAVFTYRQVRASAKKNDADAMKVITDTALALMAPLKAEIEKLTPLKEQVEKLRDELDETKDQLTDVQDELAESKEENAGIREGVQRLVDQIKEHGLEPVYTPPPIKEPRRGRRKRD